MHHLMEEFIFLSETSPIIGNACQWLTDWLTNSLTDSRLVNLIDVTLACEDGNSKLVVTVWLCLSLTHWLTDSCLVNFIDVTLAGEDGNSKLVEVATVADVELREAVKNVLADFAR